MEDNNKKGHMEILRKYNMHKCPKCGAVKNKETSIEVRGEKEIFITCERCDWQLSLVLPTKNSFLNILIEQC